MEIVDCDAYWGCKATGGYEAIIRNCKFGKCSIPVVRREYVVSTFQNNGKNVVLTKICINTNHVFTLSYDEL